MLWLRTIRRHARCFAARQSGGHQPAQPPVPRPPFARALIPFDDSDAPPVPSRWCPSTAAGLVGACQHRCPRWKSRAPPPGSGKRAARFWFWVAARRALFAFSFPNPDQSGAPDADAGRWWTGGAVVGGGGSRLRESDGTPLLPSSDTLGASKIQTL